MKKNIFPFMLNANLIADVGCLLQFIKQPIPLNKFFKDFNKDLLNTKLEHLEFESENYKNTDYFIIKLKNNKIKLTNKDLGSFGITITDPHQLINPLIDYKTVLPELDLKTTLTKLIITNNNKNNQITISSTLDSLKNIILNHPENRSKQDQINVFFNFLKKLIIQESTCEASTFTAEALLTTANDLSKLELRDPDLNTIISELHIAVKYLAASKTFLAYEKLYYKAILIFSASEKSESKIHSLIDTLVRIKTNNKTVISNYTFFKLAYFRNKGFRYHFGKNKEHDRNFYKAIQTNCECFSSFKQQYLEIFNLIQELYFLADNNQEVIILSKELTYLTDIYFQTLLDLLNSNQKNEFLEKYKKNAFIEYQARVKSNINAFREKTILNLDQINILHKILNKIAKLIPSFILSKDERISFFQLRTPQNKKLNLLLGTIRNKAR